MSRKFFIIIQIIFLCWGISSSTAGSNRLLAMGGISLSVPDTDNQINLFQAAGNSAWLINNDSLNWMKYTTFTNNDWGDLKRYWDARENHLHYLSFSGFKHIGDNQAFFGEIKYNYDYREDVNRAIEKNPYTGDPFVLADSTSGDFEYLGPEVTVIFSHKLSSGWYWGTSFNYNINRGLKDIYTETEIISRQITASVDLVHSFSENIVLGISVLPYHYQDITKLVTQSDGQYPQTFRYRGEFEFRKSTGTQDRTAIYKGYEIRPQLAIKGEKFEGVFYAEYNYQWHELYDNPTKRLYDGYYQAQKYSVNMAFRKHLGRLNQTSLAFSYEFEYTEDWAKEAAADLLFYRSFNRQHRSVLGVSHRFSDIPLEGAVEIHYQSSAPDKKDYLAHLYRQGDIANLEIHTGIEYRVGNSWKLQAGYIYKGYNEDKIWNYYGDFSGSKYTGGVDWLLKNYELEVYGRYSDLKGTVSGVNTGNKRQSMDLIVQLKQYF
ncbi:MAG: DUF6850 family outer membrane beta-barrel protein [Calditrichaceae bacterium]